MTTTTSATSSETTASNQTTSPSSSSGASTVTVSESGDVISVEYKTAKILAELQLSVTVQQAGLVFQILNWLEELLLVQPTKMAKTSF